MNTKNYFEIEIGETFNGKTVTNKEIGVDRQLMRDSGCDEEDATSYTLWYNGATKRNSVDAYDESPTGNFYIR